MTATLPAPQKGFAIKGVPLVLVENYSTGALIARIEKAESAVCKVGFGSDPIYGGNSRFPHDYVDKDATGTLDITTTRYQYGLDVAALGATVTTGTTVTMAAIGEKATVPASTAYTVTLANAATCVDTSVKVYYADHPGTLLTVDATPVAGKYSIATGVLTFAAADASKSLVIDYTYTSTTGDLVAVLTDASAPVVKITLANEFKNQDGVTTREAIFVHKCKASGDMEHGESRGKAGTPKLTFNLMDPERADKQLYTKGYIAVA